MVPARIGVDPLTVPREAWAEIGVFELRTADGRLIPSHARGDEYAARILRGEVPFESARRNAVASQTMTDGMIRAIQQGRWKGWR